MSHFQKTFPKLLNLNKIIEILLILNFGVSLKREGDLVIQCYTV